MDMSTVCSIVSRGLFSSAALQLTESGIQYCVDRKKGKREGRNTAGRTAGPDQVLRVVATVTSRLISHDSRFIFNTLTTSILRLLWNMSLGL